MIPFCSMKDLGRVCNHLSVFDYLINAWLPIQTLWGRGLRAFYSPLYPLFLTQQAHRTQPSKYPLKEWKLRNWVRWFQSPLSVLTNFESIYEKLVFTTNTQTSLLLVQWFSVLLPYGFCDQTSLIIFIAMRLPWVWSHRVWIVRNMKCTFLATNKKLCQYVIQTANQANISKYLQFEAFNYFSHFPSHFIPEWPKTWVQKRELWR